MTIEMTAEEWETNKNCEDKGRDHKFAWDPARPGTDWAYCVHCGIYQERNRRDEAKDHHQGQK